MEEIQRINITPQEEKELRRVYDYLCNFHIKTKINSELEILINQLNQVKSKISDTETKKAERDELTTELSSIQDEINNLQIKYQDIQNDPNRKICGNDLSESLRNLGKKCSKKDIQDMIWEVDENLDGCIDWEEFRLMFIRNINDTSGLEPANLYNIVQFMIFDQNNDGVVTVDETMNMLYARYGRAKMEMKIKELFGENASENGTENCEIKFLEYLKAIERIQYQTFLNTSLGKIQLAKSNKKTLSPNKTNH